MRNPAGGTTPRITARGLGISWWRIAAGTGPGSRRRRSDAARFECRPLAVEPASLVGLHRRAPVRHAGGPAAGLLPSRPVAGGRVVGGGRRSAHDRVVAGPPGARAGRSALVGGGTVAGAVPRRGAGGRRRADGREETPGARGGAGPGVRRASGVGVRPGPRPPRRGRRDRPEVARRPGAELVAVAPDAARHDGDRLGPRRCREGRAEPACGLRGAVVDGDPRHAGREGRGGAGAAPVVQRRPGRVGGRPRDAVRAQLAPRVPGPDDHAGRGGGGRSARPRVVPRVGAGAGRGQLPRRPVRHGRGLLGRAGLARPGEGGRPARDRERPASLPPGPALAGGRDGRGRRGDEPRGLRGGERGGVHRTGARRSSVRRGVLRRGPPVGRGPRRPRAGVRRRGHDAAARRRRDRREDRRGDPRAAAGVVRPAPPGRPA